MWPHVYTRLTCDVFGCVNPSLVHATTFRHCARMPSSSCSKLTRTPAPHAQDHLANLRRLTCLLCCLLADSLTATRRPAAALHGRPNMLARLHGRGCGAPAECRPHELVTWAYMGDLEQQLRPRGEERTRDGPWCNRAKLDRFRPTQG
jgi:hypothetical protein